MTFNLIGGKITHSYSIQFLLVRNIFKPCGIVSESIPLVNDAVAPPDELNNFIWQVGHDVDHFTSPEGIPGVPETNFNNRPNSFKVLAPPRTCVV